MWAGWVRDRLGEAGLGEAQEVRTLRLFGMGESQVAHLLGEGLLRATNPIVATYARADAVDVRISAVDADRTARELADEAEAQVLAAVGSHVWARGHTTWPEVLQAALEARDWTLALAESGTAGSVTTLLGGMSALRRAESRGGPPPQVRGGRGIAERLAADVAATTGADVGLAVIARERRANLLVTIAIRTPDVTVSERRVMFAGGAPGRAQAALSAADALRRVLVSGGP